MTREIILWKMGNFVGKTVFVKNRFPKIKEIMVDFSRENSYNRRDVQIRVFSYLELRIHRKQTD